jgi:hypothetical protein
MLILQPGPPFAQKPPADLMIVFFYLSNLLFLSSLVYFFWRQQQRALPGLHKLFFPALLFKLACGILLGVFYQYYYGFGDTLQFQSQSLIFYEYFLDSPLAYLRLWLTDQIESETTRMSIIYYWYSNSYFMVLLLSLLNILTGGQYYLNTLYFSFFSFFGTWQLVRAIAHHYPAWRHAAAGAFLFFPSVVFWSSGVTKEAIYLGALCWLLACLLHLPARTGWRAAWLLAGLLAAAWLLWKIKFYFAAVVYPLAFSFFLLRWATGRFVFFQSLKNQLLFFGFLLLLSLPLVSQLHAVFNLDYFLVQLMRSYEAILALSPGKPVLQFPDLAPNLGSVLAHAPLAALYATLRPFIWEGDALPYKLAGAENLLVGILILVSLVQLFKKGWGRINWFVLILLVYCLVIAALVGLTTPNVGSLSRYKTAYLPFLVFLLLASLQGSKFRRFIKNQGHWNSLARFVLRKG